VRYIVCAGRGGLRDGRAGTSYSGESAGDRKVTPEAKARLRAAFSGAGLPLRTRVPATLVTLAAAALLWLPAMHLLYRPDVSDYFAPKGIPPRARALAERHLELWTDPELRGEAIGQMRGSNAEWDFMGRTFLVLALANMGLRDEALKPRCLKAIDEIIFETLGLEQDKGLYYFLMPYARRRPWVNRPPRSLFVDGEIALMLGARQMLEERPEYRPVLAARINVILAYMKKSAVLSAESYPDECWTFCNSAALAAVRISDALDGRDHSEFIAGWLATARKKLIDERGNTGILVSEYRLNGWHEDGPEGSSIWMVAHCLSLVDEDFARDQYERARKELYRSFLGFGYAKEWPESCRGPRDVDSGPVIPVLQISAGSSGMAFLGAATFGDEKTLSGLLTSLEFGAFPVEKDGRLKYCASNQVGDAVMLYAMTMGPLWKKVKKRWAARAGERAP